MYRSKRPIRSGMRALLLVVAVAASTAAPAGVSGAASGSITKVARPAEGSSDPTWFASNRRMAVTKSGRVLVVHGLHLEGVQLKWRDPGTKWRKKTTGKVSDGLLLRGTGTGDWTASIATATDADGKEHAWVVWSGWSATGSHRLAMRRLTRLGAARGPRVGPVVTFATPSESTGPSKVDLAFEEKPSGGYRGVLTWQEEVGPSDFQIVTAWFTQLGTARPALRKKTVLFSGASYARVSTLTPTPTGVALVAKGPEGLLRLWRHDASAPLTSWVEAPAGITLGEGAYPSAVALDNGDVLAVVESAPSTDTVTVQRWSGDAEPTVDLVPLGQYEKPTITTNGEAAWIVMIRVSDRRVVSRKWNGTTWGDDVLEIGAAGGTNPEWPNAPRRTTGGKLRFVVKGPEYDENQSAVLFLQRKL